MGIEQLEQELASLKTELQALHGEINAWNVHRSNGKIGILSFTIKAVTRSNGAEVDASTIKVQVQVVGGDKESSPENSDDANTATVYDGIENDLRDIAKPFQIPLESLEIILKVTAYENNLKITEAETEIVTSAEAVSTNDNDDDNDDNNNDNENENDNDNVGEQSQLDAEPSIKSVPYVAMFDAKDTPFDTTERLDVDAVCSETGETIVLSITTLFDKCDTVLESKNNEVEQIVANIQELESLVAMANDSKSQGKSATTGKVASPKEKKTKSKKTKASSSGSSSSPSVKEIGFKTVKALIDHRACGIFVGAAIAIYCFGDYASV